MTGFNKLLKKADLQIVEEYENLSKKS